MVLVPLAKGLLLGFSVAAPVGPIGVLCIRRTLAHGRASGFVSGLGAATADAAYAVVAGLGLTAATALLVGASVPLRLAGGAFLLYLGATTFLAKPATAEAPAARSRSGLLGDWASVFALTITNPLTILSFALAFAGLGLADGAREAPEALALVAGVFLGSAAWWLLLAAGVGALRARFDAARMRLVNRVAGAAIVAFGVAALASVARALP